MRPLNVRLKLNQIRCIDVGGTGGAEPYLWTVFFKIDGETAWLSPALELRGAATVRGAPSNQGNLPRHDVEPGEAIAIPSLIGEFNTVLRPIPLEQPTGEVGEVGGVVGCIAGLVEGGSAIARGHAALVEAARECLDRLVPTLGFAHPRPTEAELAATRSKVAGAVSRAAEESLAAWGWLRGFGSEVFYYDHAQLEQAAGTPGLEICRRWKSGGDWELRGRVRASFV